MFRLMSSHNQTDYNTKKKQVTAAWRVWGL